MTVIDGPRRDWHLPQISKLILSLEDHKKVIKHKSRLYYCKSIVISTKLSILKIRLAKYELTSSKIVKLLEYKQIKYADNFITFLLNKKKSFLFLFIKFVWNWEYKEFSWWVIYSKLPDFKNVDRLFEWN